MVDDLVIGQKLGKGSGKFTEFIVEEIADAPSLGSVMIKARSSRGAAGALQGGYHGQLTIYISYRFVGEISRHFRRSSPRPDRRE